MFYFFSSTKTFGKSFQDKFFPGLKLFLWLWFFRPKSFSQQKYFQENNIFQDIFCFCFQDQIKNIFFRPIFFGYSGFNIDPTSSAALLSLSLSRKYFTQDDWSIIHGESNENLDRHGYSLKVYKNVFNFVYCQWYGCFCTVRSKLSFSDLYKLYSSVHSVHTAQEYILQWLDWKDLVALIAAPAWSLAKI